MAGVAVEWTCERAAAAGLVCSAVPRPVLYAQLCIISRRSDLDSPLHAWTARKQCGQAPAACWGQAVSRGGPRRNLLRSDRSVFSCLPTGAATRRRPAAAAYPRHSPRPQPGQAFPSPLATSTGAFDHCIAVPIVGGSCGGGSVGAGLVFASLLSLCPACLVGPCPQAEGLASLHGSPLEGLSSLHGVHRRARRRPPWRLPRLPVHPACQCVPKLQAGRGAGPGGIWAGVPWPGYEDGGARGHQAAQPGAHPRRESAGAHGAAAVFADSCAAVGPHWVQPGMPLSPRAGHAAVLGCLLLLGIVAACCTSGGRLRWRYPAAAHAQATACGRRRQTGRAARCCYKNVRA